MSNVIAKGISSKLSDDEKIQQQINLGLGNVIHTGNEQQIGVNQTWQDVTASRSAGVTYTNTTGKPIFVSISSGGTDTPGPVYGFIVDGLNMAFMFESNNFDQQHEVLVPSGATYQYVFSTGIIIKWFELR